MSFDTAGFQAIKDRMAQEWALTQFAEVPVLWPNTDDRLPGEPQAYLFVEPIVVDERLTAFGGGRGANEWEDEGFIGINVFVPVNQGVGYAYALRDAAAKIFRGQRFNSVSCFAATPAGGDSKADDGNYWLVASVVNFKYRFVG